MENKIEKRIHAQYITNFFSSMPVSKHLSFKELNTSLHTLKVY